MIVNRKIDSSVAIFTVCNIAYLHKALVLADSVFDNTGYKLNVFLFDKKQNLGLETDNLVVHWMEDIGIPNFLNLAFRYDIIEFSTALKPHLTILLLEEFEKVIFFDPDIYVYTSIDCILDDLSENAILLTPHYTTPQSDSLAESDTGMMRFGSFNLGFYGVRKSEQSQSFLNWWSKRCIDLCYMESQFGLSTDQKWVSIAPCFFSDIKISFNLGYNVAPWNSWERKIEKKYDGKRFVNNEHELVFFHFSNFNPEDPGYLNARSCYEKGVIRNDYLDIGKEYAVKHELKRSIYSHFRQVQYSYDYMSNGQYISPLLRLAYSSMYESFIETKNPFDSEGDVAKFARKNNLLGNKLRPLGYIKNALNENTPYSLQIKILNISLRLVLYLVGPNRFFLLTRALVFFSSPRRNKGLWRV